MSKSRNKKKRNGNERKKSYKVTARFATEKEFQIFLTAMKIVNAELRLPKGFAPLNPNVFAGNCCTQIGVNIINEYQAQQAKAKEESEKESDETENKVSESNSDESSTDTNEVNEDEVGTPTPEGDSEGSLGSVDDSVVDGETAGSPIVSDGESEESE